MSELPKGFGEPQGPNASERADESGVIGKIRAAVRAAWKLLFTDAESPHRAESVVEEFVFIMPEDSNEREALKEQLFRLYLSLAKEFSRRGQSREVTFCAPEISIGALDIYMLICMYQMRMIEVILAHGSMSHTKFVQNLMGQNMYNPRVFKKASELFCSNFSSMGGRVEKKQG